MYVLGYDEEIDKAEQGSEDQREDHCASEVLIRNLVVLHKARHQMRVSNIHPSPPKYGYSVCLLRLTLCSRSEHLYMSVRKLRSAVSDSVCRASIRRPM